MVLTSDDWIKAPVPWAVLNAYDPPLLEAGRLTVPALLKRQWKPSFRVDIADAVKSEDNALEVRLVILWINRMIGDEQLPEDSTRKPDGTLNAWPVWLAEGRPRPLARFTFASWRLWQKNDPLVESGLLGPVTLYVAERAPAS